MSSVDPSAPQQSTPSPPPPQFAPPPPSHWVPPPEKAGAPEGYRFAGFWIRFVAYFIDSLMITVPLVALILLYPGDAVSRTRGTGLDGAGALFLLAIVLVVFGYFPIFWARGATPGMMPFRLRVVRTKDGSRLGIGRGILRYIGFLLSASVFYIGLIWAAFDDRKQGWHDKLADSFVIRPT